MSRPRVLAVIMAGGKGERLYPLTQERSKPAIPFGGKYRIVDFVLSNFVNSGIFSCYVLVQYRSQSLIEYLRTSWNRVGITRDHFITVVPPQMRLGEAWYRGTADAVRQNLNIISDFNPDLLAVFGADHVYRMDVTQMLQHHMARQADITVAALPLPVAKASSFGILTTDHSGRITAFDEKPANPKPIPGRPDTAYCSMGNYIFTWKALQEMLTTEAAGLGDVDFGRHIIPGAIGRYRVQAYDFHQDALPGIRPYEQTHYWRDVGTLDEFWQAHMDLVGPQPKLDLANPSWPIHSSRYDGPPARFSKVDGEDVLAGEGSVLDGCKVRRSVFGRGVIVHPGCEIEDSIIMDRCEIKAGSRLKRVIVDRFNDIAAGETIGHDPAADRKRFHVDPSGITVIARGRTKV